MSTACSSMSTWGVDPPRAFWIVLGDNDDAESERAERAERADRAAAHEEEEVDELSDSEEDDESDFDPRAIFASTA